ncbi:hypothetical protein KM043_007281, partial [Ampulex compressa]
MAKKFSWRDPGTYTRISHRQRRIYRGVCTQHPAISLVYAMRLYPRQRRKILLYKKSAHEFRHSERRRKEDKGYTKEVTGVIEKKRKRRWRQFRREAVHSRGYGEHAGGDTEPNSQAATVKSMRFCEGGGFFFFFFPFFPSVTGRSTGRSVGEKERRQRETTESAGDLWRRSIQMFGESAGDRTGSGGSGGFRVGVWPYGSGEVGVCPFRRGEVGVRAFGSGGVCPGLDRVGWALPWFGPGQVGF